MRKKFVDWVIEEVNRRGWGNSELARRADLAPSSVSMVLSEQREPGYHFCVGIAKAFGKPPEQVLRLAGLLPALPVGEDVTYRDILEAVRLLSAEERERVREYVLWRLSVQGRGREGDEEE